MSKHHTHFHIQRIGSGFYLPVATPPSTGQHLMFFDEKSEEKSGKSPDDELSLKLYRTQLSPLPPLVIIDDYEVESETYAKVFGSTVIERVRTCPYRCEEEHELRKCPHFSLQKRLCSKKSYINTTLLPEDEAGFCASGVVPYCYVNGELMIFFIKEDRKYGSLTKKLFNCVGGKRDSIRITSITNDKIGGLRPETAVETAIAEFEEEVGDLIGKDSSFIFSVKNKLLSHKSPIYWSGHSKFALFPVKVDSLYCTKLQLQKNIPVDSEASEFSWMNVDNLRIGVFHDFVVPMLTDIHCDRLTFFPQ
jgi:hypothetical protein